VAGSRGLRAGFPLDRSVGSGNYHFSTVITDSDLYRLQRRLNPTNLSARHRSTSTS
jgi:hypothetical protein